MKTLEKRFIAYKAGLAHRVEYAARFIRSGRQTNRTFDSCFEMSDGDVIVTLLYRKALKGPKLAENIWNYLGRDSVEPVAFRFWTLTECQLIEMGFMMQEKARLTPVGVHFPPSHERNQPPQAMRLA